MTITLDRAPAAPDVVDDGTRREFIATGIALALGIGLAGCGGDPGPSAGDRRTVETHFGAVDVPVRAQRVAILDGYTALDTAALVGAPIVGLARNPNIPPSGIPGYIDVPGLADVPDLGWVEINFERVAAVRPDLILASTDTVSERAVHERLAAIGPAAVFENIAYNYETPRSWEIFVRRFADALGRPGPVEERIAAIDGRVARLAERLGPRRESLVVSIVRVKSTGVQLFPGQGPGAAILERLGVARPPGQRPEDEPAEFSLERIPDLDGDVILVFGTDEEERDRPYFEERFSRLPLWRRLGAVRRGDVHDVDSAPWNHAGSVQSVERILDDLERILPTVAEA